jgi:hypothetical protein
LPGDFFRSRIQNEQCHIKAFAQECILAVFVLVLFCRERLDPHALMADHSHALQLFGNILDILSLRDDAVRHIDRLKQLFIEHHQLYVILYGSAVAKPKLHLSHHIPTAVERFGILLDCFSCERRNRLLRAVASNCKGARQTERYCITRLVLDLISNIERAPCKPFSLRGHVVDDPTLIDEFRGVGNVSAVSVSRTASTPFGVLRKGTFIAIQWSNGQASVLECRFFADVRYLESLGEPTIFVHANAFSDIGSGRWSPNGVVAFFELRMVTEVLFVRTISDAIISPVWKTYR